MKCPCFTTVVINQYNKAIKGIYKEDHLLHVQQVVAMHAGSPALMHFPINHSVLYNCMNSKKLLKLQPKKITAVHALNEHYLVARINFLIGFVTLYMMEKLIHN
jgi:hypothetical protein